MEQIWIYGNSYESYLVAIVVPVERELKSWASSAGISGSIEEICKSPKVPSGRCHGRPDMVLLTAEECHGMDSRASCLQAAGHVCEEVNKVGKKGGLRGFERIKAVHLVPEQFSVDNGLMTPSFKLKRNQLQKHFQKEIDKMYADAKK